MSKLTAVVLGVITVLAFVNSFPGHFHFDDYPLILENERFTAPHFDYTAFLEQYGGRPFTFWTFWLNLQFFGENASVFHGINLALHTIVVLILFFSILKWRQNLFFATLVALIFAIHPSQNQAINYIWSRSLLLMALFVLASLLAAKRLPKISLLLWQLAVWSRFEAIVAIIPLALVNPRKRNWYLALATINLGLFFAGILYYQPQDFAWYHADPISYWLDSFAAFWWYFGHCLWPTSFSIYRGVFSPSGLVTSIAMIAFFGLLGLLWRFRKEATVPVAAVSWLILFLAPSLLIPNTEIIGDSRPYLAFAGFACLLAWLLIKIAEKTARAYSSQVPLLPRLIPFACILLILASTLPFSLWRNQVWKDEVFLWEEAISHNPGHFHPYYNLGSALARKGDWTSAREAFQRSSELNPQDDMSYAGLGYCCEMAQDWSCAARWYLTALSLNPDNHYAARGYSRVSEIIESVGSGSS